MNKPILECVNLAKTFGENQLAVEVFSKVTLSVKPGQSLAIMGPSGSGKSTLLHLLGGLDCPTAGQVFIQDTDLSKISEKMLCRLRNRTLGFVYQFHHLLPEFSALENTAMPLLIRKVSQEEAFDQAAVILRKVGLKDRLNHKPSALSGGERQRVAIARAMVTKPLCLLADEPTGNLDQDNAQRVLDWMLSLSQELTTSIIVATHDLSLAKQLKEVRVLEAGCLV